MLDFRKIQDMFVMLSGIAREHFEQHAYLCQLSAAEIESSLTDKQSITNNMDKLCAAVGALAFYRHTLINSARAGVTSFRAGDVSITEGGDGMVERARIIKDEYMQRIAHLLSDGTFVFMSTPPPAQKEDDDGQQRWW